jgi:hypothetical protein
MTSSCKWLQLWGKPGSIGLSLCRPDELGPVSAAQQLKCLTMILVAAGHQLVTSRMEKVMVNPVMLQRSKCVFHW